MEFKQFLIESENKDVQKTLGKLPKKFKGLLDGFKFKFQPNNTLNGDKTHVGIIDTDKKTVTIASPWNYPREWVLLHELGHMIWGGFVDENKQKEWSKIVKTTKEKMKDSEEELFCFAFANTYSKNKIEIHNHPEWEKFVLSLSK